MIRSIFMSMESIKKAGQDSILGLSTAMPLHQAPIRSLGRMPRTQVLVGDWIRSVSMLYMSCQ